MTENFKLCFLHAKSRDLTFYTSLLLFILDHEPLTYLYFNLQLKQPLGEMAAEIGWVFIKIVYLPGLRNSVADALSRQPGEAG